MDKLAIYLFKNLKTKQVVVSKSSNIIGKSQLANQIENNALKPLLNRPDMWSPLVVVHGFNGVAPTDPSAEPSHELHTRLFTMLSAKIPSPETRVQNFNIMSLNDYKRLPLDAKRKLEMDMIEPKLDQLCRCFLYLNNSHPDYKLNLYWDNMSYSKVIPLSGLTWPQNISHHKLQLVRGNIIVNPELKYISKVRV
ncbi:hypothetical protein AYI68_g4624 [Smittium mucronatum]|uniref:Uncharacterized protein n=1 Tax=Smittium mucronatum TaxID=133383 RepID=A0A1R0GWK8_9FUNG|nr:hypothetical protein AYI68_g4624 [Smittium mucronatum]